MEKENQRILLTKRLLKEAILRLLKETDLDKITVTELCREAGINRATFYRHYAIPKDVLAEVQNDLIYQMRQQIPIPKTMENLKPTIYALCVFIEQNKELLHLLIQCNTYTDFVHLVNDLFLEVWRDLHLSNYLKKLNQEDMHLLALYTAGGSYFILRSWLLGGIRKSAEEMAEYIDDLLNRTELMTYGRILGIPENQ